MPGEEQKKYPPHLIPYDLDLLIFLATATRSIEQSKKPIEDKLMGDRV